ncbi:unnamed protein product [Caenorhabditis bovis]|uniref:J domain-containing protein n=1 Tax=Caenorhabditis bovis TaxID=2654633 RepID=A0A8S1EX26_9PELO|nr:unnamed protein product [Caenorhabditis bovis]
MSFVDAILASEKKKPEFYEILGCDRSSTTAQIQAEFRARVRSVHPDKNEEGKCEFQKLQEAYATLTNESKRKLYDSWLDSPIPGSFEEFTRNADAIKMSTHWATPKSQAMISIGRDVDENSKWSDGRRYQSDVASKFRNYQL